MGQRFWAVFGKFSAVVAAIATILVIYKTVLPAGPRLKVVAEYSSFTLPPDVVSILEDMERRTSRSYLYEELSRLDEPNATDRQVPMRVSDCAEAISSIVGHELLEGCTSRGNRYVSFVRLVVRNRGNLPATDVVLDTPLTGLVLVTGIDESQTAVALNKRLTLGELRAKDEKRVTVWSKTTMSSSYEEDFRISCSEGTGSIAFGHTVYGLWSFLADNADFLLFVIMMSAALASMFVCAYFYERTTRNADSSDESTEEKQGPIADTTEN